MNARGCIVILGVKEEGTGDARRYRHNQFSKARQMSAKQAAFSLWYEQSGTGGGIKEFDTFYRKVRNIFNKLEKGGMVKKVEGTRGYLLEGII